MIWIFVGMASIVVGVKRGGGRGVGWGVWLVGRCLEGGDLIGLDVFSGGLVFFAGVMVGFVGGIGISGAKRGGGRGVGHGNIYCVVAIIGIVYVMVIEGWTSVVEGNGFIVG